MQTLKGFTWLLVFQCLGEVLAQLTGRLWPGPVIGMLLLAMALIWRGLQQPVSQAAHALLPHLSLLFVPIGVGVLAHTELIAQSGWVLILVIVTSTWIGMAVTALVLRALWTSNTREYRHE
jgi:holin-like protein